VKSQYNSVTVISNIYYKMKYSYSLGGATVVWTAQHCEWLNQLQGAAIIWHIFQIFKPTAQNFLMKLCYGIIFRVHTDIMCQILFNYLEDSKYDKVMWFQMRHRQPPSFDIVNNVNRTRTQQQTVGLQVSFFYNKT